MSIEISTRVWKHSTQKGTHKLFLLALADHANGDGYCYPGIERIATWCNVTDRQARRISSDLQDAGEIVVNTGGGRNGTNEYIVTAGMTPEDIEHSAVKYFGMSKKDAFDLVSAWQQKQADSLKNPDTDVSPSDSEIETETLTPMSAPPDIQRVNPDIQGRNPDTDVSRTVINHQRTIKEPSRDDFEKHSTNVRDAIKSIFTIPQEFDWKPVELLCGEIIDTDLLIQTAHNVRALQSNPFFDFRGYSKAAHFRLALQTTRRKTGSEP